MILWGAWQLYSEGCYHGPWVLCVCASTLRGTFIYIRRPHFPEFKRQPVSTPILSNLTPEGLSQGPVRRTERPQQEQRLKVADSVFPQQL